MRDSKVGAVCPIRITAFCSHTTKRAITSRPSPFRKKIRRPEAKSKKQQLPYELILFQMATVKNHNHNPSTTLQTDTAKTNKTMDTSFESTPATEIFADFVAHLTYESIDVSVVENLKKLLLDFIGIGAFAASCIESSEPFCRAILAFGGNTLGNCTAMTKGQRSFLSMLRC
jgi:hypothetical protein